MDNNGGCLNFVGFVAFIIALYIWVNNVETVNIVEQLPPPQDSWDVVYPQFRDDVSAQLLNTQKIAGSVLDETTQLKVQNAELQYSVDLLLNNLGIMKRESYEESIKQRNEQRITTVLSLILGWLFGAFITKDSMKEIQRRFSQRKKDNSTKPSTPNNVGETKNDNAENSLLKQIQKEQDRMIPERQPDDLRQELPKANQFSQVKLCSVCGKKMEIQMATIGESKGKQFFVCPNFKQCKQVLPVN